MKTTLKEIKRFAGRFDCIDVTDMRSSDAMAIADALKKTASEHNESIIEVAYSTGKYGVTGWVYQVGNQYVACTSRCSALYVLP